MKDKKLFGKLNIIDILIILILIAALVFAAVRVLKPDATTQNTPAENGVDEEGTVVDPNLRFTVLCEELPRELADSIVTALEGEDIDLDEDNVATQRQIYKSYMLYPAEVISWEILNKDGEETVDLRLTVEATADLTPGRYTVGKQEVRLGMSYNVKTMMIEVSGRVISWELLS